MGRGVGSPLRQHPAGSPPRQRIAAAAAARLSEGYDPDEYERQEEDPDDYCHRGGGPVTPLDTRLWHRPGASQASHGLERAVWTRE